MKRGDYQLKKMAQALYFVAIIESQKFKQTIISTGKNIATYSDASLLDLRKYRISQFQHSKLLFHPKYD